MIKKTILLLGVLSLLFVVACTQSVQVTNFEECVQAGNSVMESYPRQCMHEGNTFIEETSIDEPIKACTREYMPVCGLVETECDGVVCHSVEAQTFSNRCVAENANAFDIVEGPCDTIDRREQQCTDLGGSWNETHEECVGVGETQCTAMGGTFNECASACRHDPDAEFCTLQCVLVCDLS